MKSQPIPTRAYTRGEFTDAVNLSATIGWLICTITACLIDRSVVFLLPAMLFGLPLAFIICWFGVAPLLFIAMRKPISRSRALALGAAISTGLCVLFYGTTHIAAVIRTKQAFFQIATGRYYFTPDVDGIRTIQGWIDAATTTGLAVILCSLVAIAVQYCIGLGTQK